MVLVNVLLTLLVYGAIISTCFWIGKAYQGLIWFRLAIGVMIILMILDCAGVFQGVRPAVGRWLH